MKDPLLKLSLSLVMISLLVLMLFGSMAFLIYDYAKPPENRVYCGVPDPEPRPGTDSLSADGESLFNANCARCHFMQDKKLVGPGLLGITERGVTRAWLADYLHNEPYLYASGDTLAVSARRRAGKMAMDHTPFTFTAAETEALYHYLQTENNIRY